MTRKTKVKFNEETDNHNWSCVVCQKKSKTSYTINVCGWTMIFCKTCLQDLNKQITKKLS
jgi:hypothetical protein